MPSFTLTRAESLLYAAFNLLALHQSRAVSATELADHLKHKTRHAVTRMAKRLHAKNLLGLSEENGDIWLSRLCDNGISTFRQIEDSSGCGSDKTEPCVSIVMRTSGSKTVWPVKLDPMAKCATLAISRHSPSRYAQAVSKPLRKVEQAMIGQILADNTKAQFLYQNVDLIQRQLAYCLSRFEDPAHVGAQVHYLMRILSQYTQGASIMLNRNGNGNYHIPRHVLNTPADIAAFFDSLMSFANGSPVEYLAWYASLDQSRERY